MLTIKSPNIGTGDVATFKFQTGLSKYSAFYKESHNLVTNIFNDMINASILQLPYFFVKIEKVDYDWGYFISNKMINHIMAKLIMLDILLYIHFETRRVCKRIVYKKHTNN